MHRKDYWEYYQTVTYVATKLLKRYAIQSFFILKDLLMKILKSWNLFMTFASISRSISFLLEIFLFRDQVRKFLSQIVRKIKAFTCKIYQEHFRVKVFDVKNLSKFNSFTLIILSESFSMTKFSMTFELLIRQEYREYFTTISL